MSEEFLALIPILGVVFSSLAVVTMSIISLRKRHAESVYLEVLKEHRVELERLRNRVMHDGHVDSAELQVLVETLHRISLKMPNEEQRFIFEALFQDSSAGRERYCAKIFEKTGNPLDQHAA